MRKGIKYAFSEPGRPCALLFQSRRFESTHHRHKYYVCTAVKIRCLSEKSATGLSIVTDTISFIQDILRNPRIRHFSGLHTVYTIAIFRYSTLFLPRKAPQTVHVTSSRSADYKPSADRFVANTASLANVRYALTSPCRRSYECGACPTTHCSNEDWRVVTGQAVLRIAVSCMLGA